MAHLDTGEPDGAKNNKKQVRRHKWTYHWFLFGWLAHYLKNWLIIILETLFSKKKCGRLFERGDLIEDLR